MWFVYIGLALLVLLILLAWKLRTLHKPITPAQKAEVGSAWVDSTPSPVVFSVVEAREDAKKAASEQQQELAKEAEKNATSAPAAASALNDAFSKLKK